MEECNPSEVVCLGGGFFFWFGLVFKWCFRNVSKGWHFVMFQDVTAALD